MTKVLLSLLCQLKRCHPHHFPHLLVPHRQSGSTSSSSLFGLSSFWDSSFEGSGGGAIGLLFALGEKSLSEEKATFFTLRSETSESGSPSDRGCVGPELLRLLFIE